MFISGSSPSSPPRSSRIRLFGFVVPSVSIDCELRALLIVPRSRRSFRRSSSYRSWSDLLTDGCTLANACSKCAAVTVGAAEAVGKLVAAGVDATIKNADGDTALDLAKANKKRHNLIQIINPSEPMPTVAE